MNINVCFFLEFQFLLPFSNVCHFETITVTESCLFKQILNYRRTIKNKIVETVLNFDSNLGKKVSQLQNRLFQCYFFLIWYIHAFTKITTYIGVAIKKIQLTIFFWVAPLTSKFWKRLFSKCDLSIYGKLKQRIPNKLFDYKFIQLCGTVWCS